MPHQTFRSALVAAGLALALPHASIGSAVADDRPYLEALAFIYSIEASPYWSARIRGLSMDEQRSTIEIESLVVAAEKGKLVIDIENATLDGFSVIADGGFSADALEIERMTVTTATSSAVFNDIRFDDIGGPSLASVAYDQTKPFTTLVGAFAAIAKCRTSGGRIAGIDITETYEKQSSLITYRNVAFGALEDGKLARVGAAPLSLRSPAANPLAEMTVRRAEARVIDLDAIAHVLDPLRYVAGTGDGQWRAAIERASYVDLALSMPSIRLTVGAIRANDISLRQPNENFAPLLDELINPRELPPLAMKKVQSNYLGELVSAFGVEHLAIEDVVVSASGIDQLTLGAFELKDSSSDRIGEIAIADFVAAITGQGAVQVGRFAAGNVVLPSYKTIDTALDRAQRRVDVDVSSLAPEIGSLEADNLYMRAVDFPGLVVGTLRSNFANYVGSMPTTIVFDIDNLEVAAGSLPSATAQSIIAGLGYEHISANAGFNLNWDEAESTLTLEDFELDIDDLGNTTANLVLAGMTRETIEDAGDASALDGLVFEKARVTFEDRSLVDRSLSMRADLLNVPLDRLKQQLSGALPLMLAVLGDQAKAMIPVLQNFIESPGTITIDATPDSPVPVADIASAVRRPQTLPGLLGISLSDGSTVKEEPEQPESAAGEEKTIIEETTK